MTSVAPPESPEASGVGTPVGRAQADYFLAPQKVRGRREGANSAAEGFSYKSYPVGTPMKWTGGFW